MHTLPEPSFRPPFLSRAFREPLVHFLVTGVAIFALQAIIAKPPAAQEGQGGRIVITQGRVQQIVAIFAGTWQRPPTAAELRGLIDAYVREEVYYREAVKLGLDRDDTVVRRRMQQKMEFLIEPDDGSLIPTEAELQEHLAANRQSFRIPPKIAFDQIFISPERESPEGRATSILEELKVASSDVQPAAFGDRTLLPVGMALSPVDVVAGSFGRIFADTLAKLPAGEWAGPVPSAYGLHLVRVTDRRDAVDPPLDEIREAVRNHWRRMQREAHMRAEYGRLRGNYDVVAAYDIPKASAE